MPGSTPNFNLIYFDFSQPLDSEFNVQAEIDRFLMIDKQLWGLYHVFGSGVISGWTVTDNAFSQTRGISITVSPGVGIIRYIASETRFPDTVDFLPPNSTVDIYAVLQGSTPRERTVRFVYSVSALGDSALKLATITTSANSVENIDASVRDLIGFEAIIQDEIDQHRHRGSPTKINLETETKGQLPGAKIADLDTAKVKSGRFDIDRIPIIDHEDLGNKGLTTHAGIDSFIKTIDKSNKELLGEVASVNLMKSMIFLRSRYSNADEHLINTLLYLPGISPNSYVDFDATTAHVDLVSQCISGTPAKNGKNISIIWDDNDSFANAYSKTNVTAADNIVKLTKDLTETYVIDDFEGSPSSNASLNTYVKQMAVLTDQMQVKAEDGYLFTQQGFYSGRFKAQRTFRALFTKTFTTAADWSSFDELAIHIKTISFSHGPVYAYFVNEVTGVETNSETFLLLQEDELTTDSDPANNNFKEEIFDITGIDRDNVTKFVIFTDDIETDFTFYLDNIFVRTQNLYKSQGTIRFRYLGGAQVVFQSIIYDITKPENTDVSIRIRTASAVSLLSRSAFSFPLQSGQVFSREGFVAEIEVTLSTTDNTVTPVLDSIELRILADSALQGFILEDSSDWSRGDLKNAQIVSGDLYGDSHLSIQTPVAVENTAFASFNTVQEVNADKVAISGFNGSKLPLAPNQVFINGRNATAKLNNAVSAERLFDKTFVVCDLDNDRVLLIDDDGNLIKGFGSNNVLSDSFFPLMSNYNPDTGVLSIALTQAIDPGSVDVTKMSLFIGSTKLPFSALDVVQDNNKVGAAVEILLSSSKVSALLTTNSTNIRVEIRDGAFPLNFESSDSNPLFAGLLPVSISYFTFIDGIVHPVFAMITETDENWLICNSITPEPKPEPVPGAPTEEEEENTVTAIIEINPDTQATTFSYNDVVFSSQALGSVAEIGYNSIVIGALVKSTDTLSVAEEDKTGLESYRGVVLILDKTSKSISLRYNSPDGLYPSDVAVTSGGEILVAESSLISVAGRVIRLDLSGNIQWQIGNGRFKAINDARPRNNSNVVISI